MKKKTFFVLILSLLLLSTVSLLINYYNREEKTPENTQSDYVKTFKQKESVHITDNDKPKQAETTRESVKEKGPVLSEIMNSPSRPIAVMIDNDNSDAWPHAGLEDAYTIYEIIVEGGSTRLMALFKDADTEKVGPIRSSRHYFVDYAMDNDAIYVHFGWSPQAAKYIINNNTNNINGVAGSDEWIFWREPKYKYDYHDVYTSMENITDIVANKGYRTADSSNIYNIYKSEITIGNGINANAVTIPYSRYHTTYYEYDPSIKEYLRWMRNTEHISSTANKQLSAKNIIIQFVKNYYIGDGEPHKDRQELENTGSGNGYYITNGKSAKITWEKPSHSKKTVYKFENGEEISLNEGLTFIQIVPINSKVTIDASST